MRNRHEEPKQAIKVLGDKWYGFELYRWREAFMCFLDLIWSGKYNYGVNGGELAKENRRSGDGNVLLCIETKEPITGHRNDRAWLHLAFDSKTELYDAAGAADTLSFNRGHIMLYGALNATRGEFESLLARFARNHHVHGLVLPLTNKHHVAEIAMKNERGRIKVGIQH